MSKVNVQLCPETGICSIIKANGQKVDLMPDEVGAVREAAGDPDAIKRTLAEIDTSFAGALDADELAEVADGLK